MAVTGFHMLSSHIWLLATTLDGADIKVSSPEKVILNSEVLHDIYMRMSFLLLRLFCNGYTPFLLNTPLLCFPFYPYASLFKLLFKQSTGLHQLLPNKAYLCACMSLSQCESLMTWQSYMSHIF